MKTLFETTINLGHVLDISHENLLQFDIIGDPYWGMNVRSQLAIIAWNRYGHSAYEKSGGDVESAEYLKYASARAMTAMSFKCSSEGVIVTIYDKLRSE